MSGKENRPGLWHNIHAKRERIARGSGERMRRPGSEGAPTAEALRESKTAAAYYGEGVNTAVEALGLRKLAGYSYDYGSGGGRLRYSDPDIAELREGQREWHRMSPEERADFADAHSGLKPLATGMGSALGGVGGYAILKALAENAGAIPSALAVGAGAVGGGLTGSRLADYGNEQISNDPLVSPQLSYQLARRQLARDAAEEVADSADKTAAEINPFELPLEELRGLARSRSILKNIGAHALTGAGVGGITGALGADPDDRVEGALRGVVGGSLAGGGLGGLSEGLAALRGFSPEHITRMEGVVKGQELKRELARKALVSGKSTAAVSSAADLAEAERSLKSLQDAERKILTSAYEHNTPAAILNPLVSGSVGYMLGETPRGRDNG